MSRYQPRKLDKKVLKKEVRKQVMKFKLAFTNEISEILHYVTLGINAKYAYIINKIKKEIRDTR